MQISQIAKFSVKTHFVRTGHIYEHYRQFKSAMQIVTEVRQQNVATQRQLTLSHNAVTQDMSFIDCYG